MGSFGALRAAGLPAGVAPGGVLLTGGASKRMGFDKALLQVDGAPNAVRLGRVLSRVARPVLEVGPGRSGLPWLMEVPPGGGPLVALCAGAEALVRLGHNGAVLVVACDMPYLGEAALRSIAEWEGDGSVVPVVEGRLQPLCARWSCDDLRVAARLVSEGERSMKALLSLTVVETLGPGHWPEGVTARDFADVDTRAELEAHHLLPPNEGNAGEGNAV
jgi:molybdenum cofactor guanylyltransferase